MQKIISLNRVCILDCRVGIRQCQKYLFFRNLPIDRIRQFIPENGDHKIHRSIPVHPRQIFKISIPEDHVHIRITFHETLQRLRYNGNGAPLLDPYPDRRMAFMQFVFQKAIKLCL